MARGRKLNYLLFALAIFAPLSSHAGIILTLEGTSGSSDFTLSASGSFTSTGPALSNQNGDWFRIIRTDLGSTGWYTPTGMGWSGDIFGVDPGIGSVALGTGGTLTFDVTGAVTSTHTYDDVMAGGEVWVPYDASNSNNWPDVPSGDTVTITASGSINFTAGITFDDLNIGSYTYDRPMQDTLQYVVRNATAVPEAGTLSLLGIGLLGLAFARRRTT